MHDLQWSVISSFNRISISIFCCKTLLVANVHVDNKLAEIAATINYLRLQDRRGCIQRNYITFYSESQSTITTNDTCLAKLGTINVDLRSEKVARNVPVAIKTTAAHKRSSCYFSSKVQPRGVGVMVIVLAKQFCCCPSRELLITRACSIAW